MGKATRRRYSWEYKRAAVAMHREQGYTKAEVARRLGIERSMLDRWERKLHGNGQEAASAPGSGGAGEDERDAELRRLREENRKLREDKAILKKAAAFFANE